MPRLKLIVLSVFILCFSSRTGFAQSQERAYALLMVNFIKGIQWPANAGQEKFVLGVWGYSPLAAELNSALQATNTGKRVEVREFESPEEITNCQMLFVPAYKSRQFATLTGKFQNTPTLFVTNKMDLAKKGSHITFVTVDGNLRYEINCKSIEQRGMKIASSIKGLGIIVE